MGAEGDHGVELGDLGACLCGGFVGLSRVGCGEREDFGGGGIG